MNSPAIYLLVQIEKLPAGQKITLEQYGQAGQRNLKVAAPDLKILTESDISIGGQPGHAIVYNLASLSRAREYTKQALAADPRNPVALKNLGAILGKEGDSLRALYYLRRSNECDPQDPQTVHGLAFAYMELGDIEPAQKHFQAVLEMEAPEELRSLARDGLSKIAARELKARGPRMDAVFYLLDAMRLFRGMSLQEVQEITFEIGMLGKYWLDINDPQESHVLRALPGRTFSALQLICIMYAGFKRIEPGMDIGVGLGEEWGMAERLGGEESRD